MSNNNNNKKYTNLYNQPEKEDDDLYKYYNNSHTATNTQQNLQNRYELDRAHRQMSHYCDPSKQPTNTTTTSIPVTKAQLDYWKQKKEEKKKKKDAWLYE